MTTYLVFQKINGSNRRGCVGGFTCGSREAGAVRAAMEAWLESQGTNNARRIYSAKPEAAHERARRAKGK